MEKLTCKSCCPICKKTVKGNCTCCSKKSCSNECKKCCGICPGHKETPKTHSCCGGCKSCK